jgi:MerR family transcriptional regulator, thiopeptide resistance regulator
MASRLRSISEVAQLAGVSVRALHHYDEIGLLVPSARSENGYRRYSDEDVRRLLSVVVFKQLGFSLDAIERLLDDPVIDRVKVLEDQRVALLTQIDEKQAALRAIDAALEMEGKGELTMTNDILNDEEKHRRFEAEAKQRWGHTEAYKISMERAKDYTPEDWAKIKAEREAIYARLGTLMSEGKAPGDDVVLDVVEEHRAHLERWFYPCSKAMHRGLGRMFADDPRFAANFEKIQPGLAVFVAAAFDAHATKE